MTGLEARGRAIGEARAAAARERLCAELDALLGIAAEVEGDRVVLRGAGLARRALSDPALRSRAMQVRR